MPPSQQRYEQLAQAGDEPLSLDEHDDGDLADSDDNDDTTTIHRSSTDMRTHDLETLTAEEEAERLLTGGSEPHEKCERKRRRRERKSRRRDKGEDRGEKEVMFRMEEGDERDSSREAERDGVSRADLRDMRKRRRKRCCARCCTAATIYIVIAVLFLALLFGAWSATAAGRRKIQQGGEGKGNYTAQPLSNGTHVFAPTTIMISLDGFRADFLHRNITPTLSGFVRNGVSPRFMMPSFPSVTFPNHFTLVTGMYPESHGIVSNTFWDPDTQKEFYYTDPEKSMKPEWWVAEPIWETAELAGVRSAIHMWPGSEAHIGRLEPTYVDKFDGAESLDRKVDRILGWLDLPGSNETDTNSSAPRPQLIAAYVPDVDADGHQYGPNSSYIRSTIREADSMLGKLFKGIDERNLTQVVNIVVVSDHGMASTDIDRLIQLEDVLDTSLIEHTDGWPLYGLRPYDHSPEHLQQLYDLVHAKSQLPQYKGAFEVYLRDSNMPARYHFSNNLRIAPLWIVPTTGWAIVTKPEFNIATAKQQGLIYHPRGLHGYDHEHPLMRAIFVAQGPAFPHAPGSKLAPFQNTEVYNIICDSLGLTPGRNNGTLRLPLVTQGLHDFASYAQPDDLPGDFAEHDDLVDVVDEVPTVLNLNDQLVDPADPLAVAEPQIATSDVSEESEMAIPDRPEIHDKEPEEAAEQAKQETAFNRWMAWMQAKLDAFQEWAAGGFKEHEAEGEAA